MLEIFKNYWDNKAFVYLHACVLLLSLGMIALWCSRFRLIRGVISLSLDQGTSSRPRSESELARLVAPLEPFASYFDYCSSAFIFVGLLGTIFGFVSGVPKMANDNYQFEDILRALSTSAMGIMLALVFNFVTMALDYLLFRPILDGLRLQFQSDSLEVSIRENLSRLEDTLRTTLVTFNSGVSQITASLDAWNITSQQTLTEQSNVAKDIAATHQSFVETHKGLLILPESIRKQLAGVFSEATTSMGTTLGKVKTALESFEKLPAKIEAGLDKSFQKRQDALEQALDRYRASIESQRSSLDELYAKLKALPVDVVESLSQSNAKSIVLMEQSHAAFLNSLKTAVRATVEDQMASLGALVGQMDLNAKTLREKWDALLVSERKTFEGAVLSALHAAIQTVEEQRKKLLTLESALPESLANTFHELIRESQAATRSLNEATRQEDVSMRELQTAIAELTAALQRPDRVPGDQQMRPTPLPQDRAPSPPTSPSSEPMRSSSPGAFRGPVPTAQPARTVEDPHLAPAAITVPDRMVEFETTAGAPVEQTGFGRITDAPPVPDERDEQRVQSAPIMPSVSTVDTDGKRRHWWPRRLWEKVRSNGGPPSS